MSQKIVVEDFSRNFFSKRKKEKEKFNFWVTYTYVALLVIIILLFLYYVWILNVNATKWYDIIELELQKRNLLMEKERLDMKIAELESLTNIMNDSDLKNMEKVNDPNFLVIKDDVQYVYNYKKIKIYIIQNISKKIIMLTSLILWINLAFLNVINENELFWADMKYTRIWWSTYSSVYWLDISKANKDLATDYDTMIFYLKNVKDFPSGVTIWWKQDKKEVERFLVELKNIINSRKEKLDSYVYWKLHW